MGGDWHIFPTFALRSRTRKAISESLFRKLASGQALDDADIEYFGNVLKPAEAKWIKQKMVYERAAQILTSSPPRAALPPHEESSKESDASSRDDWFAKFWDDAGLVSDERLREIYARILVAEGTVPGSCSMRTLKAIRYLDPQMANLFAKVMPLVFSFNWIPNHDSICEKYGVTLSELLELQDAELLHVDNELRTKTTGSISYDHWGNRIIRYKNFDIIPLKTFPLTRAGRDLARVATVDRIPEYFQDIVQYFARLRLVNQGIFVATCPEGIGPENLLPSDLEQLNWTEVIQDSSRPI